MSKYYYVDSENFGNDWIKLLEESDADSHFLIFYTTKSPHISYPNMVKLLSFNQKIEFILCHEGNNALDFQLVTYLGYQLCKETDNEIFIVSKDTGFDAVIRFWTERNISIKRIVSVNCKNDEPDNPVYSDIDAISIPELSLTSETICGESKQIIDDIIAALPSDNTSHLHMFLTHFYGNQNGLNIYKQVISKDYQPVSRNWNDKMRFSIICQYIGKYTAVDDVVVNDELIEFLYKHRQNPDYVLKFLPDHYGTEKGTRYKKAFKPFVKSLAKI